jgi:putative hemolysin
MDPVTVLAAPQKDSFMIEYNHNYTMRKLLIFIIFALAVSGQRKPVTLDSLNQLRGRVREVPGEPVWAPDGKTFAYRQGQKLMLYDLSEKRTREVISLEPLDEAAVKTPRSESYDWENRRVSEAPLQWDSTGSELLYLSGGDLFLIEIAGGKWRQVTRTASAERDPKFSPNGRRVAFQRDWDLYTLDVTSGKETRLTSNGSDALRNGALDWVYPEELDLGTAYWWSPDSKSIGFWAGGKLKRVTVDGGAPVAICDLPGGWSGTWGTNGEILIQVAVPIPFPPIFQAITIAIVAGEEPPLPEWHAERGEVVRRSQTRSYS